MRELTNSCCLHHVSGGWGWNGDPNCPGCNGKWDNKQSDTAQVLGNVIGGLVGRE